MERGTRRKGTRNEDKVKENKKRNERNIKKETVEQGRNRKGQVKGNRTEQGIKQRRYGKEETKKRGKNSC